MTSDLSTPSSSPVALLSPFSVPIRRVPSFFQARTNEFSDDDELMVVALGQTPQKLAI